MKGEGKVCCKNMADGLGTVQQPRTRVLRLLNYPSSPLLFAL